MRLKNKCYATEQFGQNNKIFTSDLKQRVSKNIYIYKYALLSQSRLTTKDYRNSRYEW